MALTPFQSYSLESLGIPEATLQQTSFRVSQTEGILTTASTIYLISLEPLTLITEIPNKVDGAFPSSVKNHILLCKGDKAQLLDVQEKKTIAIFHHEVFLGICDNENWLMLTNSGVYNTNYYFSEVTLLHSIQLNIQESFYAQWADNNQTVFAFLSDQRKCLVSGKIENEENVILAHGREYSEKDLYNARACCYIKCYDLVVVAVDDAVLLIHYGQIVSRIPITENVVLLFENEQGFSVLTAQMLVESFRIPMTIIEDLPVEHLFESCITTNYFNHRIGPSIISKYADYCFKNEQYQQAAEAVVENEEARDYVLNQTELSENFANYAQELMKLDRLTKEETLALANRLQEAGKVAGLIKFEDRVTYSSALAEFIIAENELVDRELSKLLIRIYDEIGDFEKVARFLIKNESAKSGIEYCEMKGFTFDILNVVREYNIEMDKTDAINVMNLNLFGGDLEAVCALAVKQGVQIELIEFLASEKESPIANTLKLKYMMEFTSPSKRKEVELKLAQLLMKESVIPEILVVACAEEKFECLRLLVILRYELSEYTLDDLDFKLFDQIIRECPLTEEFKPEFLEFLVLEVHSHELAESLSKIVEAEKVVANTHFEEIALYRKVFCGNVVEKRERYFEVLVLNYIKNGVFDEKPFNYFFEELRLSLTEIEEFEIELSHEQQRFLVRAVAKELKVEEDFRHLVSFNCIDAEILYSEIYQSYNSSENVEMISLLYAELGYFKPLEEHILGLPAFLEERVIILLTKYEYEEHADELQHLLEYVVIKSPLKPESETYKMLNNILFADNSKYDEILVNQRLVCDVILEIEHLEELETVKILEMVKTFDEVELYPLFHRLLGNEMTKIVQNAIIELALALGTEEILLEIMKTFEQDTYMALATNTRNAELLCEVALLADSIDYSQLYRECEGFLLENEEDLLLKIALKVENEELCLDLLTKVDCSCTSEHIALAEGMPMVQYVLYVKSEEFLQALELAVHNNLEVDLYEVAENSQDVICCNYLIEERCEIEFAQCFELFKENKDLTSCSNMIKAVATHSMDEREDLAETLIELREISENKSYDIQICKYLGIIYQDGSERGKSLLIGIVPQLKTDEAEVIGDQLFLLEHFKAARTFYEQAGNMKALNDCCLRVGDFAGALKSAVKQNSEALFEGMLSFPETRIFGLANLLGDSSALKAFCESVDNEFISDLEIAMEMCVFANISDNQAQLSENIDEINQDGVLSVRKDIESDFAWGRRFVLNTFCPQLYSALCILLLRSGNIRIMHILKLFHTKIALEQIRDEARARCAVDAEIFCSVALGDIRSSILTLIEYENNITELIKLLSFNQDADLHLKAAEMLREVDEDSYFDHYLPQSWHIETLEVACAVCSTDKLAHRLCLFIYDEKLFGIEAAAEFCFKHDPENVNLAGFIGKCDPLPLLRLTTRRKLRVALLVSAGETEAALNECTDEEFTELVDAASRIAESAFSFRVLEKVSSSEEFDQYLKVLLNDLKLSELMRLCITCGARPHLIEAMADAVEKLENKILQ